MKYLKIIIFIMSSVFVTSAQQSISGIITYLDNPIEGVSIIIKGSQRGTQSNENGFFKIEAKTGDVLSFSHVSYQPIEIVIEDITSTLNLELNEKNNELDEVVVKAKINRDDAFKYNNRNGGPIMTAVGIVNPENFSGSLMYFDKRDLVNQNDSFSSYWNNLYAGSEKFVMGAGTGKRLRTLPSTWDVDGIIYQNEPPINFNRVIDIHVIFKGATQWGTMGGVVIVRTLDSPFIIAQQNEELAESYRNQTFYTDNAKSLDNADTFTSNDLQKTVSGTVTTDGIPISNVNVIIQGTSKGTKTDSEGFYTIEASIGDILHFSHVGLKSVSIVIEDITETLNVDMKAEVNQLDEAVVNARIDATSVSELEKKMDVDLLTPFGTINPKTSGLSIAYVPGKELNPAGGIGSLSGKASGIRIVGTTLLIRERPATFIVDGLTTDFTDIPDVSNIADIYVIKNHALVYIVTNNSVQIQNQRRNTMTEQYKNQNFYQQDAQTDSKTTFSSSSISTVQRNQRIEKEISGTVTYLDTPMPLVNIKVVGKTVGVVTNPNGQYTIKAHVGDILQYSHLGYATVSIIVEDVTEILDVEMVLEENELDEILITADGEINKSAQRAKKADATFDTSRGSFDPKTSGNAISYIDGSDTTAGARDILDVLQGKVAGITVNRETNEVIMRSTGSINTDVPPLWDVDGSVVSYIPNIAPDDVEDIYLLKSLAATNKYGSQGRGGVIVIRTRTGNFSATQSANKERIAEQYRNQEFYANDASQIALTRLNSNSYADALEAFDTKQKAFIYYQEHLKYKATSYADKIAIAQKFVTHFNDLTLSSELFKNLIEDYNDHPEILKAIAYHLQTIGRKKEAIEAYERTFKLRPTYAQSYRDLANAYMENDQYKKAWRLYMSYLLQGHDLSGEGIGELIYNEMEWLYFSRKNQTDIKENFIPKSKDLFDFRNDVRIVIEWNASEAEFDLEFVNPEKRSYVFEHSLAANQELITDEKRQGYSCKEFFIDDLQNGEWLVNITYKGNKKPQPTYFKITKFFNWGKASQTKEIAVYKFQNEREKIQLMTFDKNILSATN